MILIFLSSQKFLHIVKDTACSFNSSSYFFLTASICSDDLAQVDILMHLLHFFSIHFQTYGRICFRHAEDDRFCFCDINL